MEDKCNKRKADRMLFLRVFFTILRNLIPNKTSLKRSNFQYLKNVSYRQFPKLNFGWFQHHFQ